MHTLANGTGSPVWTSRTVKDLCWACKFNVIVQIKKTVDIFKKTFTFWFYFFKEISRRSSQKHTQMNAVFFNFISNLQRFPLRSSARKIFYFILSVVNIIPPVAEPSKPVKNNLYISSSLVFTK